MFDRGPKATTKRSPQAEVREADVVRCGTDESQNSAPTIHGQRMIGAICSRSDLLNGVLHRRERRTNVRSL